MMKSPISTIVFILLLSLFVLAQSQKTDRETDGLKGSVKSVLTEIADLKKLAANWLNLNEETKKPLPTTAKETK